MTKTKTTKRALLLSALSLLLSVSMLIGSTFAWFTDSVTNGNNIIQSGNLDIELWHCPNNQAKWGHGYDEAAGEEIEGDTALFLNADGKPILWEPGAGAGETFRVKNAGTLALKYKFIIRTVDITQTPEGKDLTDILSMQIIELENNENGAPGLATDGVYYEALLGDGYVIEDELLPGETVDYNVAIDWVPSSIDNEFNVKGGLKLTFAVDLIATQLTYEKDSYDDQYDKDSAYPEIYEVATVSELTNAIANASSGDTVRMEEDLALGSSQLAITKDITLDLNGNTLNADNGWGIISLKNGASIKNGTIDVDSNVAAIRAFNVGSIENVTIDIAPKASEKVATAIAVQNGGHIESIKNVTIINSTQGIEIGKGAKVDLIENVNVTATSNGSKPGIALQINAGYVGKVVNSTFNGEAYGAHMMLNGEFDVALELEDCNVTGNTAAIYAHDEVGISNIKNCSLTLTYDAATVLNGGLKWEFEDECKHVVTLNAPN